MKRTSVFLNVGVVIFLLLAIGFPKAWAANEEPIRCATNSTCIVGEFLYSDTYVPVIGASCSITMYQSGGAILFGGSQPVTGDSHGWYQYSVDTTGLVDGVYPTQLCCTPADGLVCLDKSFSIGPVTLSPNQVGNAVWDATVSAHTTTGTFGKNVQNPTVTANDIWTYSGRALDTVNNIATAIWSASGRSLDDVASLISGLGLSGGKTVATNVDVATLSGQIAGVQTTVNTIEGKVDSLSSTLGSMNTNVSAILAKWGSYSMSQIAGYVTSIQASLGSSADTCAGSTTVFGQIACVSDKWEAQTGDTLFAAANSAATASAALMAELDYNGKTTTAYQDLQTVKTNVAALNTLVGLDTDSATSLTLFGKIKDVRNQLDTINGSSASLTDLLAKWGSYSATDIYDKVKNLSDQISAVNTVSNVSSILTLAQNQATDQKSLMNSVLALQALLQVNQTLLEQVNDKPIIKTWLENGSVIFKTLITNPSQSISQSVPLSFELPREASSKDVIKIDTGLKVVYNPQQDAYDVVGTYLLAPGETRIVSVEVQDIWKFSPVELDSITKQADELFAPLKGTSNFAQGATLKADITASLDHIRLLTDNATTPEERILAYREGLIDLNKAKSDVSNLKILVNSTGAASNLQGFIGGVQVVGTWGLIIVLIGGFVFLSIYFGFLMRKKTEIQQPADEPVIPPQEAIRPVHHHRVATLVMICLTTAGLTIGTFVLVNKSAPTSETAQQTKTDTSVLGTSSRKNNDIQISLPDGIHEINVRAAPYIYGPVINSIRMPLTGTELQRLAGWVRVQLESTASALPIIGWVSDEFVTVKQ